MSRKILLKLIISFPFYRGEKEVVCKFEVREQTCR